MLNFEQIKEINSRLKPVDIRGKNYNTVAARVLAFRELLPTGCIKTEILNQDADSCTIQASVYLGDLLLATGTAHEEKSSSPVNKTSYVENCETSAVGRALGFLGIGSTESIATAEEVEAAQEQQSRFRTINGKEQKLLHDLLTEKGKSINDFADITHDARGWKDITAEMFAQIVRRLQDDEDPNRFAPGD